MLANEDRRVVYRVGRRLGHIVRDLHGGRCTRAECRSGRITEKNGEGFGTFGVRVFANEQINSLARFARGKAQSSNRSSVIGTF